MNPPLSKMRELVIPLVLDHGHHFSSETLLLQESQDDRVAISLSSEPDEMVSIAPKSMIQEQVWE